MTELHVKFQEWLAIAETYPPPMREAARYFRHHKLRRAEPQTGVYYWVPLPGGQWKMMSFFENHYGQALHDQIWRREVLPFLAHRWKLNRSQTVTIRDVYAGLPRGRVTRVEEGYAHHHGGDAPTDKLEMLVKREFGLAFVQSMLDDHERMLLDDVRAVESVLGNLGLTGC